MKILAPAKINIVLRVLGRRPDGYHDLFMLNEKLTVADEITIEAGNHASCVMPHASDIPITITCDDASVPCDETNICHKVAKAILCQQGQSDQQCRQSIKIHIKKNIPVAAGLGGGSSDGAAVLKGINEILDLKLSNENLAEIGVKLGADVPLFLYDGPAICEGIGDKITTLKKLPNMWILLVNPNFPVSTKWVYEEFDKLQGLQLTEQNQGVSSLPSPAEDLLAGRDFKGLDDLAKVVHNDLELVTVAKYPEIGEIKKMIKGRGAVHSWMSGSGPTVVGMFENEKMCHVAAEKMRAHDPSWLVIETQN
ncbi:MAG: 4-(cytidine 5'-diphospho)-2-C-methyl-D-erythritol kinase [Deltaproteobacteria bacterium CG11_big_fil_rev_8_21_14_0_20_49_13]|nr:MAG: 4-(cytidine 5'-diphospho)-2-C-methyl-D-erythritol kinase [Deltaproteobacteria bacterium CG11_big_fil_rev_8_21_14_0_20_49_13]